MGGGKYSKKNKVKGKHNKDYWSSQRGKRPNSTPSPSEATGRAKARRLSSPEDAAAGESSSTPLSQVLMDSRVELDGSSLSPVATSIRPEEPAPQAAANSSTHPPSTSTPNIMPRAASFTPTRGSPAQGSSGALSAGQLAVNEGDVRNPVEFMDHFDTLISNELK